jgi:gliding motility-associated-like protein
VVENQAAIKIAMELSGVGASIQSSIDGVNRDTSGCVPLEVFFRDTIAQAVSYVWDFGDGSAQVTTTTPNTSHVFNTVGTFRVMLVGIDSSKCNIADTSFLNLRVRNDDAILSFNYVKLPPCENLSFQFTNTSIPPSAKPFTSNSFRWDFGDGSTPVVAGTNTVTHTYAAAGTYNVRLILQDTNYCNSPDTAVETIRISPLVDARFETPATGCAPYTAVFNNTSLAGTSFIWDFGDGTSSTATNPTHLYNMPGSYTIRLIANDPATCNLTDTTFFVLTVSSLPVANFSISPAVNPLPENTPATYINGSTGASRYIWRFGDGDTLLTVRRDTAVVHTFNATGDYISCLEAINDAGCRDTTCLPISARIVAVFDVPSAFTPNGDGRNDQVFVKGFGIATLHWRIYNRWGVLVFETKNRNQGWNGYYKNVLQPQEVYHYTLEVSFTNGSRAQKTGDITLLR